MEAKQGLDRIERAKEFFKRYYRRTSVLVTQIPYELRAIVLPNHMLFGSFKAVMYLDMTGRLALEITRKRSSRISIKSRETTERIESLVIGRLGERNSLSIQGRNTVLRGLVFADATFVSRFSHKIPDRDIWPFGPSSDVGPIEVAEEADVKLVDVSVCLVVHGKPCVKHIPFAWLLGKADLLNDSDPSVAADSDFYLSLFGSVHYLVTQGHEKLSPETKRRVFEVYSRFLSRIEEDLAASFRLTEADERTFHQLLERYRFFICPQAMSIESEVPIGNYRADFLIRSGIDEITLIEIEPAHLKPFTDHSASVRLQGALGQVANWKDVSEKKVEFFGKHVTFWVLIGLLEDMTEDEKACLERFNRDTRDVAILTYDHMIQNVQSTRQLLDKLRE